MDQPACFKCDHPLQSAASKCPRCGWNGGSGLLPDDERYLVLVALIYRIPEAGSRVMPYTFRIEASNREMAVLQHGDQCELDGTKWRISAKNTAKKTFFVKGFKIIQFSNQQFFEFEAEDPADEIKDEMKKWRDLHSAYYEMWQLKKRNQLKGYLRRPEKKKKVYRSHIQDETPYLK